MRLVVQIPCHNEAGSLPQTLREIPRDIPGINEVSVLVVDDGSSDDTVSVALDNGADFVVSHHQNRGLSQSFITGINTAIALGADIIVNTDGDNQYPGRFIPDLVQPIINREADIAIGNRNPGKNIHFSSTKRFFQIVGSKVVQALSGIEVPDAASGFRAYTRDAASRIQVTNIFSYTVETIIQAGNEKMGIMFVPIETNKATRPSRLHKGLINFIWTQAGIILRTYVLYKPLRTFGTMSLIFMIGGMIPIIRFVILFIIGQTGVARYIQSVTIGGVMFIFGFLLMLLGLLGESMYSTRHINIEILARMKQSLTLSDLDKSSQHKIIFREGSEDTDLQHHAKAK